MRPIALAALAVTLSACSPQLSQHSVLSAADPNATTSVRPYYSVAAETKNYQPVEPRPWAESNSSVSAGGSK